MSSPAASHCYTWAPFQAQGINQKDPALSAHCIVVTSLLELLTVASAVNATVFSFGISEIQAN